ncbi:hypothetical protein ZWY2020_055652 [Hordeum vulgare]|nr:hypothetical protein ZWY2020_055652 [Hordeum vulgare]
METLSSLTEIGGDEWDHFIARMHLTWGELIKLYFRRQTPRLAVIYLNSEEEDKDPLHKALYAQRMIELCEDETYKLWEKLPPRDDYIEMPFMTPVTRSMVNHHVMKLPKRLCESCGIEPDEAGIARLRITTRGSITTCTYAVDTDGRTIFSATG